MNKKFINVIRLERTFSAGGAESISFEPGVNLMIGLPNTGKTKWLQTLDYLLADAGEAPYSDQSDEDYDLLDKYSEASAQLSVGDEKILVVRKWKEVGSKTKVFVDGEAMSTIEFQTLLLDKLDIPVVNFPKGNPMSGQTWPFLSFRIMLRHMYRQQRFWGELADRQSEPEQHAALLQFLGIAGRIFTEDYGRLVQLRMQADKLRAKRESYSATLNELALELLSEPELTVDVNEQTVRDAAERLEKKQDELLTRRKTVLASSLSSIEQKNRSIVESLTETRSSIVNEIESLHTRILEATERYKEMQSYANGVQDELERLQRAEDAGHVLADLKVTHCPACDQTVLEHEHDSDGHCFLCHQGLPDAPAIDELGTLRLRYEMTRVESELLEAKELLPVLGNDVAKLQARRIVLSDDLRALDSKLAPTRQALSPLVQESVSSIDMELGEFAERQRHLTRLGDAVEGGRRLSEEILSLEREIEPLKHRIDIAIQATDFEDSASKLADGMNAYLSAINALQPNVWKHSKVNISLGRNSFSFRVGSKKWSSALGGTDTLYFLMAYHYGLLALCSQTECNFPGLLIIDFPGEFSGEKVKDIENFVVQPFIDLVQREEYVGVQVIITGPSFVGLDVAHREVFDHIYLAQ